MLDDELFMCFLPPTVYRNKELLNMRARFDEEEPDPRWSSRDISSWLLKHADTGTAGQTEYPRGTVPAKKQEKTEQTGVS